MIGFFSRPIRALKRVPRIQDWIATLSVYVCLVIVAFVSAKLLKFPELKLAPFLSIQLWLWVAFLFVTPGITEEILFRSLILRFSDEVSSVEFLLRWVVSQVLFIAWHPFLGLLTPGRAIFSDLRFLFLASLLGIGSSYLYLRTRSLWPSIIFHWAIVVSWYLFGGGYLLLHPEATFARSLVR